MSKIKAGIIGATGMVGRVITLLENHYFEISPLAPKSSRGKPMKKP